MKNIKLKMFLENYVMPLISKMNSMTHHQDNRVLFYINSTFRESSKVLFDYMIENGYNSKYEIVVCSYDCKQLSKHKLRNVHYKGTGITAFIEFFRSKYVFYSIGKIPLYPAKNQIVMQMWHGVPLKEADPSLKKSRSNKHKYYTWFLSTSEFLKPVFSRWHSVPEKRMYIGGYPRCDYLFNQEKKYDFGNYKKLILWTPTFRKSAIRDYSDVDMKSKIVPILENNMIAQFNDYLKQLGVKVIVKLHPAQDLANYTLLEMDHFILLSHGEFTKRGMDLYYLASQSDALITDYSSIYFDFMLIDRPIGFTIDDIEEYETNRGFALDPNKFMPGNRMSSYQELKDFVRDVVNNIDHYRAERHQVNKMINQYQNGDYSKRILDFVGIV